MNREERANIPTKEAALNRMHSVISGIQRSFVHGNFNCFIKACQLGNILQWWADFYPWIWYYYLKKKHMIFKNAVTNIWIWGCIVFS